MKETAQKRTLIHRTLGVETKDFTTDTSHAIQRPERIIVVQTFDWPKKILPANKMLIRKSSQYEKNPKFLKQLWNGTARRHREHQLEYERWSEAPHKNIHHLRIFCLGYVSPRRTHLSRAGRRLGLGHPGPGAAKYLCDRGGRLPRRRGGVPAGRPPPRSSFGRGGGAAVAGGGHGGAPAELSHGGGRHGRRRLRGRGGYERMYARVYVGTNPTTKVGNILQY